MIKKLTAFSFLLLASMLLLAHAVLPHHHHHQQVCIETTHCNTDEEDHAHKSSETDHQHDGSTDSSTCVLKQAYIIPSSQERFVNNLNNPQDNLHFFIFSNFEQVDLQPVSDYIKFTPKLFSFYTKFITPTLGLRAPPIV